MAEITMHNIEKYLNFQEVEQVDNIEWIEPIFISAYKAYLEENNLEPKIKNTYLHQMLTTDYTEGKTYSPIENICTRRDIEKISDHLVSIMMKRFVLYSEEYKNDIKHYLRYLFSEMMNNVVDHSASPIGGYAIAQFYTSKKIVQFAIADRGIGFLENVKLKENVNNEGEAIKIALQKGFTASENRMYSHERNAGFGLYAMKGILEQTGGLFTIISNDTIYRFYNNREKIEKLSTPYKGVIVSFLFYTNEINLTLEEFQRGYLWYNEDEDDELLY